MRLRNWIWVSMAAGPRLTWWLALVYFGAPVLIVAALVIGLLLAVPKLIVKEWLQVVRDIIW
jgi:hypothetical protein